LSAPIRDLHRNDGFGDRHLKPLGGVAHGRERGFRAGCARCRGGRFRGMQRRPRGNIPASKFRVQGKMSVFGGPNDTGMKEEEGLALYNSEAEMQAHGVGDFLLPPNGYGLGRRLNTEKFYVACRWWGYGLKRSFMQDALVVVGNPRTRRQEIARAIDYGPNENTGRVADLSPGLARALGLNTDDICTVTIPANQEEPMPAPTPATTAPAASPNDALIKALTGFVEVVGPIVVDKVKETAQDPAAQKAAVSLAMRLLPSIGTLFPQLGIFGIAAGYVLPLLLPDVIGPTGGTATIATSGGVVAASLFGMLKRGVDKLLAPRPAPAAEPAQ
jgi:hypothetical protein